MDLRNACLFAAGIGFLGLAKTKNLLRGYTTPKPFDVSDSEKCIDYDIRIVELWLAYLQQYSRGRVSLAGRYVLELGPGSDLGIGLYLLSRGCQQYSACDVNNLVASVPDAFYERLFDRIGRLDLHADIDTLRRELSLTRRGTPDRLNYVVRSDFDLVAAVGESQIDLVFSQAAFEHFDDIDATIAQLSRVCRPGAISIIEIDLKTHSRWIRERDPNNIYRYPDIIYSAFRFRGIPNRVRPYQYKEAFERHGWSNVSVFPLQKADDEDSCYAGMHGTFTERKNQMEYLSIMLCATRDYVQ
jgi:SAM-dependent methyltransferase